jgi:hypothetical protein
VGESSSVGNFVMKILKDFVRVSMDGGSRNVAEMRGCGDLVGEILY